MPLYTSLSALSPIIPKVSTTTPVISTTTQTTAVKYTAPVLEVSPILQSSVQNVEEILKTNDQTLSEQVSSFNIVSTMVDKVVALAVADLELTRAQISVASDVIIVDEAISSKVLSVIDEPVKKLETVNAIVSELVKETDFFAVSSVINVEQQVVNEVPQVFNVPTSITSKIEEINQVTETRYEAASVSPLPSILQLDKVEAATDIVQRVVESVLVSKNETITEQAFNPVVPNIDEILVDIDKNRGTIDCFYSRMKFSILKSQAENSNVRAFRIFRTTILNPVFNRTEKPTLSIRGIEQLSTLKMSNSSLSSGQLSMIEKRYEELGISNAITELSPIDLASNVRVSSNAFDQVPQTLDKSVSLDTNFIRNSEIQNPTMFSLSQQITVNDVQLANRGELVQQVDIGKDLSSLVVSENNKQCYREIAFLSLDKLKSTTSGDYNVYEFYDESIGFARGYKYYVTTVDDNMVESTRSKIVEIVVECIRVPSRPKNVISRNLDGIVTLTIEIDEQLVEKFEIFRKSVDEFVEESMFASSISGIDGFNVSTVLSKTLPNGFIKIGDSLNGKYGSSFYDRNVTPGKSYIYRVFSVDIFGNKSESPYEVNVLVNDRQKGNNDLTNPFITVEIDAETHKARVTFKCVDDRVKSLFIARRDLTLGQKAFTTPSQTNSVKLGTSSSGDGQTRFEGIVFKGGNKDTSWTGMFENAGKEIRFIDYTTTLDHIYQYQVHGVDKYGNSTSFKVSNNVMITRRPMINPPINVTAVIQQGADFTVGGINLRWQDGNTDISSEDMLGNRDALNASSVRTLYQVERKKQGEERWVEFPLIDTKTLFDPASSTVGEQVQNDRPSHVESGRTYSYRIKALQTGSYVSNYSDAVEIFAGLKIVAPVDFRINASDSSVKPFYLVLNWSTPNNSGEIDRWEIERAVVNNFAASNLNVRNPSDFQKLVFESHRVVYRESNRSTSKELDESIRSSTSIAQSQMDISSVFSMNNRGLFTGDHNFQDAEIMFGNSYFYRIRAVGVNDEISEWIYRGMKVTDSSFDRKLDSIITNDVKKMLTDSFVPLVVSSLQESQNPNSSFSLSPSFSIPSILPTVSVVQKTTELPYMGEVKPLPTNDFVKLS